MHEAFFGRASAHRLLDFRPEVMGVAQKDRRGSPKTSLGRGTGVSSNLSNIVAFEAVAKRAFVCIAATSSDTLYRAEQS